MYLLVENSFIGMNDKISVLQNKIGKLKFQNKDSQKSLQEAFSYFLKSAKRGYANAQYNLGKCYENGQGVEKSLKKAAKYYKKAVDQDHLEASNSLTKVRRGE